MGVARADGQPVPTIGIAPDGTRIFQRRVAHGFFIVVEAKEGPSRLPVGTSTFNPSGLPQFQMVASDTLGNGSAAVCDDGPFPPPGGVPAVNPPAFGGSQEIVNAINDLACRFEARTGLNGSDACTRNASQESAFLGVGTKVQFCPVVAIGSELALKVGDTRFTARVTDSIGQPGMPASIIIRFTP
jgi:hypothetical protein